MEANSTESIKKCPKCDAVLDDKAKFCPNCGNEILRDNEKTKVSAIYNTSPVYHSKGLPVLLTFVFGPFGLLYTKKWIWASICIGMYSFLGYDLIANFDFGLYLFPINILSKIIDLNSQDALYNTRDVQDMGVMVGIWVLSLITSYDWVASLEEENKRSERINSSNNKTMENQLNNSDEIRVLKYELKKKKAWIAFFLTLFFGPFGLFYTGKWVVSLIMVLLELYQIFDYTNNALSLNLAMFSRNVMYIVAIYFISLVLAPILTASYNNDLWKEMNAKQNKNRNKEEN